MQPVRIRPARDVERAAIEACLAIVEARDPLVVPADRSEALGADAVVAVAPDAPQTTEVLGVAWRRPREDGYVLDVRVPPGRRRRGVGSALLEHLAGGAGPLHASCDAGHPRVRRFLVRRGFKLEGVIFHQRWDGEPDEVPRAFPSVELRDEPDLEVTCALLREAGADAWPALAPPASVPVGPSPRARTAWLHGERVGALLAHREPDAWTVDALAVRPDARGQGAGRVMLCELMALAAAEGTGVTLRVGRPASPAQGGEAEPAIAEDGLLAWTRALGFWTYRAWACYRRA